MQKFLVSSQYIDWDHPAVVAQAELLSQNNENESAIAKNCFEFVRDEISHSGDIQSDQVNCKASDVLAAGTGWCFAKSHLLAALLRANNIPAALCYQRLTKDDGEAYTFHGLNSVYLPEWGWYRCDPRGNKAGVEAEFCPPVEKLAWTASEHGEIDFSALFEEPIAEVITCLTNSRSYDETYQSLPDGKEI